MSRDIKAGGAYVELLLKSQSFVAGLKSASSRLKSFGDSAKRIGSLGFLGGGGGGGIGRLFAGAGAAAALAFPVKLAANLEVAKAEFTALIGDADKANKLFAEMQGFALISPLGVKDLGDAGRKLLTAGMAVDEIMPKLRQLGEIAGGDGEKLNRLALAFGQTISKGRLMGQEANQMAESGFSPLAEISRTTGESMKSLMARMEAGGVTVAEVSNAFQTATSAGGRFKGLLAAIAATASGQFNQFREALMMAITPIGDALLPSIKGILKAANEAMPAFAKIVKDNAGIAVSIGSAVVAIAAGGAALISFGVAAQVAAFSLAGVATAIGLLLNPITLVAGAVAGLGYWLATSTEWGRTMVTSLAGWFGKLREIAVEAFGGIADALAAGDLALAGKVAWLGLKAAWLQGTKDLREIWESFKHLFVSTTIDITYGALAHWETFVANVKTLFTGLKGAAMDTALDVGAWLNKIGKSDEEKAAIDKVTAMAKAGFAGKQKADLAAIVAQKEQALKDLEASRKLDQGIQQDAFFGRMEQINKDLAAAKAELAKAREDAAKARAAGGLEAIAGAKGFDPANFQMDAASLKNNIFGSFSGAALAAQGGAGGEVQKLADLFRSWTRDQRRDYREFLREWRQANKVGP